METVRDSAEMLVARIRHMRPHVTKWMIIRAVITLELLSPVPELNEGWDGIICLIQTGGLSSNCLQIIQGVLDLPDRSNEAVLRQLMHG